MQALRLERWKSDPVLTEVPEPEAGPGQVVVAIDGAGACGSDLHLLHEVEPGTRPYEPPFTLGHENAGRVHAVGDGVDGVEVGRPVAVYGPWGCGICPRCQVGSENYCERPDLAPAPGGGGGLGADGGMAPLMLVPQARQVVPLPDGLDPVVAAPLTDAGLTAYHAVRRSWSTLPPGSTAVVIGAGGLGHLGIQALKATTAARVIAADTSADALALAARVGADATVTSDDTAADEIREITGGRGAEVVFDFVGADATLALAARVVRPLGDLTIVGIGGGTLPVSLRGLAREVKVVTTTYWGSRPELREVLDLAARGLLRPEFTTYSLADAPAAYRALAAGQVRGRAVITPNLPG